MKVTDNDYKYEYFIENIMIIIDFFVIICVNNIDENDTLQVQSR